MGGAVTGGRIDVVADHDSSAWSEQVVELRVKLRDSACVAEFVHGLQRDDEIEASGNRIGPSLLFEIRLNEDGSVFVFCEAASAELQHLRREIDQRVARDVTIFQQRFGEEARSAAQLEDRQCPLLHPRGFGGEGLE